MYGILKAGIAIEGQQRHLKILRVGSWYTKNDIPGMPPLLKRYEEKVDLEQEEAEAAAAEEAAPAAQGAGENAGEKEGAPPPEGGAEPNALSSGEAAPAGASRRRTRG
jgi:hypothetical protein